MSKPDIIIKTLNIFILCLGVRQGFISCYARRHILKGYTPQYTIYRDSSIKELTLLEHISGTILHAVPLIIIIWIYTRELNIVNISIILGSIYITIISYYITILDYKEFTEEILQYKSEDFIDIANRINKFCDSRIYEGDSIYYVKKYKETLKCKLVQETH